MAVSTGLFEPDEAQALLGRTLSEIHAMRGGVGHATLVWTEHASRAPEGWAYFAPDPYQESVWNLWWIGVQPRAQGKRAGRVLLDAVEARVTAEGGRLLIIETSALVPLQRAREFYRRSGYQECGRIPDFYADGDAKVIFCKRLAQSGGRAPA